MANLDDLIARMKADFLNKMSRVGNMTEAINSAVKAYHAAVADDIEKDLNAKLYGDGTYEPQAPKAADKILDLVGKLPEFGGLLQFSMNTEVAEEPDDSVDQAPVPFAQDDRPFFPLLAEKSKTRPILLYGGTLMHERLNWVRGLGLQVEWIESEKDGGRVRSMQSAVTKIQNGTVLFVLYAGGFVSHSTGAQVVEAARKANVLLLDVRTAGQGQVTRALRKAEQLYATAAESMQPANK